MCKNCIRIRSIRGFFFTSHLCNTSFCRLAGIFKLVHANINVNEDKKVYPCLQFIHEIVKKGFLVFLEKHSRFILFLVCLFVVELAGKIKSLAHA